MNKKKIILIIITILLVKWIMSNHKGAEQNPNKGIYTSPYKDKITLKYAAEYAEIKNTAKALSDKIIKTKSHFDDFKQETLTTYYDINNNLIYKSLQDETIEQSSLGSGNKGGYGSPTKKSPKQDGYEYDKDGRIVKQIEINKKIVTGFGSSIKDFSYLAQIKTPALNNGTGEFFGDIKYITYKYSNIGNIEEEMEIDFESTWNIKKYNRKYKSGKLIEERYMEDQENGDDRSLIIVNITKEYDENGKMIIKHVTRKNKNNAIRSETYFDLIKGEIVTKYYDGDKAFATVTETLVGEDKAIVKRERAGDKIRIFDAVEYIKKDQFDYKKYKNYYSLYNKRYVFDRIGEIKFKVDFLLGSYEYNDTRIEGQIDYDSFKYEGYFDGDESGTYSKISSKINNIFEIKKINEETSEVTEWYLNREEYLKVLKDIMVGTMNENTKQYLGMKKKTQVKNILLKEELENIIGGNRE